MRYKLGSLFDGSGGFPLAGALCNVDPVWAAEIEPYPIAVTRSRFPNMKHLGDISKIHGGEIEPVDIITFGSPCQDLSVAGKRAGLKHEANGDEETTRSGLFMEAVRIIKEMREATNGKYPTFALWENVPGAFSSNKGEDFRIVCEELIKIVEPAASMPAVPEGGWAYSDSYVGDGWSLAYRVFDAQHWGVPQRRRRVHLVTDFSSQRAREVLFEREGVRGYFAQGTTPRQTTPADAQGSTGADDREGESGIDCLTPWDSQTHRCYSTTGVAPSLCAGAETSGQNQQAFLVAVSNGAGGRQLDAVTLEPGIAAREGGHIYEGVSGTLRANMGDNQMAVAYPEGNYIDVEMEVAVRKYEVNCKLLCECLRDHKTASNFSNKDIAEQLDLPLTMVEHWFRQDTYFAVPEPEVWPRLKRLLGIKTDEFDESIMTFEFKGGTYDMRNRTHMGETAPTLTCGSGNTLHLVPKEPVYSIENHPADSRVNIDDTGKVQTLTGRMGTGGGNVPMVREPKVFESHPMDSRVKEVGDIGPTVTTKYAKGGVDTPLVMEPFCKSARAQSKDDATTWKPGRVANTLNTFDQGEARANELGVNSTLVARGPSGVAYESPVRYIVRRLTPTECARLQGFTDWWSVVEQKDSLANEEHRFWLEVRNTHAAINGKKVQDYTETQMLTWYNKLYTDSAEYKMWGNCIALPPALYCLQGIVDALNKPEEGDAWMY